MCVCTQGSKIVTPHFSGPPIPPLWLQVIATSTPQACTEDYNNYIKAAEKHQESLKHLQLEVNHKSNFVNTALLKHVIISPHLCLKKASLCLWPNKAPHHQWFTLRGAAALWGLFSSPEVSLPGFLLRLVSGCFAPPRGTIVLSAALHSSEMISPFTPFCSFRWPVEQRVHMQVWAGTANGHGELEWVEKTRPGGEMQAPCWEVAGALNSESECRPMKLLTILV